MAPLKSPGEQLISITFCFVMGQQAKKYVFCYVTERA